VAFPQAGNSCILDGGAYFSILAMASRQLMRDAQCGLALRRRDMTSDDRENQTRISNLRFFRLATGIAVVACVALFVCVAGTFLLVDPSTTRCPGWVAVEKSGGTYSLWGLLVMQAFGAAVMSWIAFNWRRNYQRIIDDAWKQFETTWPLLLNQNKLFGAVCAGWTLCFCIPLLIIVTRCF
jgi:hypothetical protein